MTTDTLAANLADYVEDPREFVAAYEARLDRDGAPMPLRAAVTRWQRTGRLS